MRTRLRYYVQPLYQTESTRGWGPINFKHKGLPHAEGEQLLTDRRKDCEKSCKIKLFQLKQHRSGNLCRIRVNQRRFTLPQSYGAADESELPGRCYWVDRHFP